MSNAANVYWRWEFSSSMYATSAQPSELGSAIGTSLRVRPTVAGGYIFGWPCHTPHIHVAQPQQVGKYT
jgi:hypothetical protein